MKLLYLLAFGFYLLTKKIMSIRVYDDDYYIWKTFDFKNHWKNECLEKFPRLSLKKTGTTIAAISFVNGIIMASDTRATSETIICDKNCDKIHFLSNNIACCGAGTSADTEHLSKMISEQTELQEIFSQSESLIKPAVLMIRKILYQYEGYISAALIIGGYDSTGKNLYGIYPHGSYEKIPFIAMGSGSVAAMSTLEKLYCNFINLESAIYAIKEAILAGIFNDLGSGGNIDLCIIKKDSLDFTRNIFDKNISSLKSNCNFEKICLSSTI